MNQLKRIWIWCKRIRYLNGFGVQSPFAFSFVHSVIYQKLPRDIRKKLKAYRLFSPYTIKQPLPSRVERLLYKLVQYTNPAFIIYIEKEYSGGIHSLTLDSHCPCFGYIENKADVSEKIQRLYDEKPQITFGNLKKTLREKLETHASIAFVYIDLKVKDAPYFCEKILSRCRPNSLVIIGNIHTNKINKKLWTTLTKDKRTALSFDLYTVGILMFDHHYHQQQYIINFEG